MRENGRGPMKDVDYFMQVYGTLPRAGPGDNASTARAFEMCERLVDRPEILDIGCGPGAQTLELARLSNGNITALDLYPNMLDRVKEAVKDNGLEDRIKTVQMDMKVMNFGPETFDLIWSEGAIYFLGFENGLRTVRPLLKPGGYLVVSEAVWLKPDPPKEVLYFWREYPEIDLMEEKLKIVDKLDFEESGHFVLPWTSWTELYYKPMKEKMVELETLWEDDPQGQAVLEEAKSEIAVFEKYHEYYSYGFFIMRKPD
jgi:cyclopropane fatty-acyl-phospholipid synthase-like methyltransferase